MASQPTSIDFTLPTTNTDGSAIPPGELIDVDFGYGTTSAAGAPTFMYSTIVSKAFTVVDPTNAAVVTVPWASLGQPVLTPGTWFFAVRVKSGAGTTSIWSNEAQFVVPVPVPNPPSGFTVV
jgi:hypothetical protein